VWLLVVAAIAGSLAWASLAVRRIVKQAHPLDTADWRTPLWEVADRMGLDEVPRLLRSDEAKMPFACGLATPTIVLPAESDNWTLDRRRAVLLHELAHVRRHDLLGHTLGRLVCAVYWFHPLVWTAAKQLRNESERACDDLALSCGTRATDYAEHLLDIVTSVRRDATPSVALAMARRKEFEGRMLAILDPELRRSTPSRRQSAVLISTLALVALTVGAAAPVPRDAEARVAVKEHHVDAADHAAIPTDAPLQEPVRVGTYPDSGVRGERTMTRQRDFQRSVTVSKSVSTSTATSTVTAVDPTLGPSLSNIVTMGMKAGVNAAAKALSSPEVAAALESAAPTARAAALREIMQDKSIPKDDRPILLAKVLRTDTSATLRRIAAWGLQEYTEVPVASAALAAAVRGDANESVREMAAWALGNGENGNSAAIDALTSALKSDASEKVRTTAAWALGNIGDRSSVDGLVAALSDKSASVRNRAIWALGNVEPKNAPSALVAMLKDENPRVRRMTAWALFTIEDPSAAPALQAALKTEQDKDIQVDYIRALASLGENSIDAIKDLLESSDPRIKGMAVRALAGGHAAGPWPMPWPEPRPFP
jgi:HEAT repeat protein